MSSRRDIELELQSHLIEAADELRAQGVSNDDAQQQARERFGSTENILAAITALEPHRAWWTPHASAALGAVVAIVISLGYWLRQYPFSSVTFQPISLSLVYLGVFAAVTIVVKWICEYYGLQSRQAAWLSLLFALLVNFSVTTVFDLDKVFIPLHALMVAGAVIAFVVWRWTSLSVLGKRAVVYGFTLLTTWSAFHNQPMLSWLQTPPCIYITPDQVPAEQLAKCQHWSWETSGLWPIYLVALTGLFMCARFLIRYWHSRGSFRYRKLLLTMAMAAVPLVPLGMHDINNYGQLDIINWKPEIYQAYLDILGRRPQQSDIDFYSLTRSYQVMPKVKAVLYASRERRIKIDLLHQEILHRPASTAEIQYFVDSKLTIEKIRAALSSQP